jgi:hypothetical protein
MRPLLLLWVAACSPDHLDEPLAPLPLLDPSPGFEAWAAMPPPPLSACAGWAALRAGLQYTSSAQAVADALPGDTVWLCPGVHTEPLEFANPGRYALAGASRTRGDVVIDGTGFLLPAVKAWQGIQLQVRDLTFTGSAGENAISTDESDAIHASNLYFFDLDGGSAVTSKRTVFTRIDNLEYEESVGRSINIRSEYPYPPRPWPPTEVIMNDVYVHDVNVFSGGWMEFVGSENDRTHPNYPYLTVRANNIEFENIHVQRESIINISGDSYDIEMSNLRIRDVALTPFTPTACGYSNLIEQRSQWEYPKAKLELTNFSITDTFSNILFNRYAYEIRARNELRTILRDGEFLRNTVCAEVFVPVYGTTRVDNVDFGEGADANIGDDFHGPCADADLGNGESFGQYQEYYRTWTGWQSQFTCWP